MPGIGGYWTPHQKILWGNQTQKFINPMIWRKEDQVKMFDIPDKGVLLSSISSPTYHISGTEKDRFYKSVFFGKLYSINNEKSLSDHYHLHCYMVEEYLENGQDFLTKVEGVFLLAIYDYLRDELSIINDAFGTIPLNFYFNNDDLIFSSQIQSIQSLTSTRLNELAFAEHLSMGITLNGKTFLKDVDRMWPGSILKINRQKFEKIKYFKPVYDINTDMHIEKKLQITGDIFKNFIKENLDPDLNIAAALSGGYDSRFFWSAI